MRLSYDPDTDALYIHFREIAGSDVEEIAPGVVVDLDNEGKIVGMEILDASESVDLTKLETRAFPPETHKLAV